ncbi:MAG: hypothetical protein ACXWUG_22875, partial [Polyangiales bacterium]
LALAEALRASGHAERAKAAIATAHERLLARAASIEDATLRARFLEVVPANADTIAFAGTLAASR